MAFVQAGTAAERDFPSSPRATQAAERVTPGLKRSLGEKGLKWGAPIFIQIFKESNELELWVQGESGFRLFRTYPICAYSGDLGPKLKQGDGQSPEGFYSVGAAELNPYSQFHLSFNLGYPNAYDRAHGRTGSALMVHGNCVSIGCYAMTDAGIEEIYTLAAAALRNGQAHFQVNSYPFRMTAENMKRHSSSPWSGFWSTLKAGYDHFQKTRTPPRIRVNGGEYRVVVPD